MAGLYVHVPFRYERRPYDESEYEAGRSPDVPAFETALRRELRFYAHRFAEDEPMTTIYAGGGRPSLLPLSTVHSILTTLVEVFDASTFQEATAEISPADAEPRYVHGLKRMGFDRLSLEVLSFFPNALATLNASHTAVQGVRAIQVVREAAFDSLSVELLFGWDTLSLENWEATLRHAVAMNIPHITISEVPEGRMEKASSDELADQMKLAITFLQSEGYHQYELTHFARSGHRSKHQENYYAHGNYLGIGPSAETFWWPARSSRARRWANVNDPSRYAQLLDDRHPPVAYRRTLDAQSLAREYIFLRLRTESGLSLPEFQERYGIDLRSENEELLDLLRDVGMIHEEPNTVRLTIQGRLVADAITQRLMPS